MSMIEPLLYVVYDHRLSSVNSSSVMCVLSARTNHRPTVFGVKESQETPTVVSCKASSVPYRSIKQLAMASFELSTERIEKNSTVQSPCRYT